MILRIRTPVRMYRIEVDYTTDCVSHIQHTLGSMMSVKPEDILLSLTRNSHIFLDSHIRLNTLGLNNGDILYGDTRCKKRVPSKIPPKLSHIKKKWTMNDLREYENRNTHKIELGEGDLKGVYIDNKQVNTFIQTCRTYGFGAQRFAKLYGYIRDGNAYIETLYIPEQYSLEDRAYTNTEREDYYRDSIDYIHQSLKLTYIGEITFYINDSWKGRDTLLTMLNRSSLGDYVTLICYPRKNDDDITVEAFNPHRSVIELYKKKYIYFSHGDKDKITIKPEHTLVYKGKTMTESVSHDLFFTPIPIVQSDYSHFYVHDFPFIQDWRPKRRYNFKQFREWMIRHCPLPKHIDEFIYDISFLVYIKQWFTKDDFNILLNGVRNKSIKPGFYIIICNICGIK